MKSTPDNAIDSLGSLGKPLRDPKPAAPDPVRDFEHIADTNKALETIAETLRKQLPIVIEDGQEVDWEGLGLRNVLDDIHEQSLRKQALDFSNDPYIRALLGSI